MHSPSDASVFSISSSVRPIKSKRASAFKDRAISRIELPRFSSGDLWTGAQFWVHSQNSFLASVKSACLSVLPETSESTVTNSEISILRRKNVLRWRSHYIKMLHYLFKSHGFFWFQKLFRFSSELLEIPLNFWYPKNPSRMHLKTNNKQNKRKKFSWSYYSVNFVHNYALFYLKIVRW